VPKRVDHEERRRQIADALLRTAATRGLHATGMREVAAEADVSLRLVQYYFGTKEELLLAAMQQLAAQFGGRVMARIKKIKETQDPVSPREVIAAILTEALPADDERRTFTVLYTAYFALSLTDPALAIAPLVKNSAAVIDVVAAQLRSAQAAGDTPARLEPGLEAVSLLAMSAGLGTSILAGQSSPGQAQAVIDYHLYRLFPASRPALRRAPDESTGHWPPCSAQQSPGPSCRRHEAQVLRPRGVRRQLALTLTAMLPSAQRHGVGSPEVDISRLNSPACAYPVNASPAPSWTPAHDSGPWWLARPST
jgi:AcrR family transcriptional regulator